MYPNDGHQAGESSLPLTLPLALTDYPGEHHVQPRIGRLNRGLGRRDYSRPNEQFGERLSNLPTTGRPLNGRRELPSVPVVGVYILRPGSPTATLQVNVRIDPQASQATNHRLLGVESGRTWSGRLIPPTEPSIVRAVLIIPAVYGLSNRVFIVFPVLKLALKTTRQEVRLSPVYQVLEPTQQTEASSPRLHLQFGLGITDPTVGIPPRATRILRPGQGDAAIRLLSLQWARRVPMVTGGLVVRVWNRQGESSSPLSVRRAVFIL